jgi:hypothetical protein
VQDLRSRTESTYYEGEEKHCGSGGVWGSNGERREHTISMVAAEGCRDLRRKKRAQCMHGGSGGVQGSKEESREEAWWQRRGAGIY